MVGFVKFVVAGIDEVFFALRLAVIAVRHHQIPVHGLFDGILRGVEGVLAFANVLDDGGGDSSHIVQTVTGFSHDALCDFPILHNHAKRGILKPV